MDVNPEYQEDILQVDDLIGIPWKEDGLVLEDGGLNCWGLVKVVALRLGMEIPAFDEYVDQMATQIGEQLREGFERFSGLFEPVEDPEEGDLVFFEIGDKCHIGVMLSASWFVHSRERIGVCKTRIRSLEYKPFFKGYYRWTA